MKKWLTRHFFSTFCLLRFFIAQRTFELLDLTMDKQAVLLNVSVGGADVSVTSLVTSDNHALLVGKVSNATIFQ